MRSLKRGAGPCDQSMTCRREKKSGSLSRTGCLTPKWCQNGKKIESGRCLEIFEDVRDGSLPRRAKRSMVLMNAKDGMLLAEFVACGELEEALQGISFERGLQ